MTQRLISNQLSTELLLAWLLDCSLDRAPCVLHSEGGWLGLEWHLVWGVGCRWPWHCQLHQSHLRPPLCMWQPCIRLYSTIVQMAAHRWCCCAAMPASPADAAGSGSAWPLVAVGCGGEGGQGPWGRWCGGGRSSRGLLPRKQPTLIRATRVLGLAGLVHVAWIGTTIVVHRPPGRLTHSNGHRFGIGLA